MQPTTDQSGGSGGSLRRWGPVAGMVAVAAIITAIAVVGGGDDDNVDGETGGTGGQQATAITTPEGEPVYPFSWADGEASGLAALDWGERCDVDRGTLAIPDLPPQPCYLPFDGDNGGATAQGVTGDTIKVVMYLGPEDDPVIDYITDAIRSDDTNAEMKSTLDDLVAFYETYHETYGRHVEVEYYESEGTAEDATTARADAVKIAEDMKPFQVWGGPALTDAFGDELAARGIQCIGCAGGSQAAFEARSPYGIGLALTGEQGRAHDVAVLSRQVAGRNAEYAGDPEMQGQERVFGYLHLETGDPQSAEDARATVDALEEAGVEITETVPYALDPATLQETAASAIAKLKQSGVTTVIFAGDPIAPRDFTREATKQEYFPEWFLNVSGLVDTNVFARTYDQEQWKHAFGLTPLAARVDPEQASRRSVYEWFYGEAPAAEDAIAVISGNPALFYMVLQEVGPDLTNEGFLAALFRLEPTPSLLTAPSLSWGRHDRWPGVDGDDYQGVDDITKIWWDAEATGLDELRNDGAGVWRFVDGGKRYLVADWPEEDFGAFDREDTSTIYEDTPASEAPPDYEPLSVR